MNVVNSTVWPLSFAQQQSAPEPASKPAPQNVLPSALDVAHDSAAKSVGRDIAAIEYEMFADEGDRFSREGRRRLSKVNFIKKKKPLAPDGNKNPDVGKLPDADANKPGSSGAGAFDKDIAAEQAGFKVESDQLGKFEYEKITIVEPASVHLSVPNANVNGKAISPFSSDTLKKAKKEFEEATATPDANKAEKTASEDVKADADESVTPEKKLSDTKKLIIVLGVQSAVTTAVAAITKTIEKHLGDDISAKFKTTLADTKIIDQLQIDVFDAVNILAGLQKGGKEMKPDFQWALKSDAERMTSLESITIHLERGFVEMAKKVGVDFSWGDSRIEEPSVEGRAKNIEGRLAVMADLTAEVTRKLNALA
ncbi:hypothetical protein ACI77N_17180 [Pseudomonas sp. S191]|uniref:hypothetical protein n=1 Tax=Pseudomonas sp. S191 TaxID=579575 RepID=UPI00387AAD23